ncbi:uncharacterized protein ARMOST_22158 [Armillaria ostoyae]|uniref:Uncharacterized protein n=1 Tax=Armillaria ostoyae TaxID=47428 RepID=A0A284SC34_ARMOS|nr:uncharacterized protein ARMOST_22158 [Armillaria ostoyae]
MEPVQSSKLATLAQLACEELKKDEGATNSRPSLEWFATHPTIRSKWEYHDSQSRPTKRMKVENAKSILVNRADLNDGLEYPSLIQSAITNEPALDTSLRAQFLS